MKVTKKILHSSPPPPPRNSSFHPQNEKQVIDFRLFVTGMKSNISIQSTTMTNIAFVSYADFIEELKRFHKDYVHPPPPPLTNSIASIPSNCYF